MPECLKLELPNPRALKSIVFALLIITALIFLTQFEPAKQFYSTIINYIDNNRLVGSFIFILLFSIVSCLMIPITIFLLSAGVLFRPWPIAVLISILGIELGVIFGMLAGRSFLRPWVSSLVEQDKRYKAIDDAVLQFGWKVVVLIRLTPVIPLGLANYLFSTTQLKITTVLAATIIGCVPGYTLVPVMGSMMRSLQETREYSLPLKYKLVGGLVAVCTVFGSSILMATIGQSALRNMTGADFRGGSMSSEHCETKDKVKGSVKLDERDKMIIKVTFCIIFIILAVGIPTILLKV